jgi:hypothetical protein
MAKKRVALNRNLILHNRTWWTRIVWRGEDGRLHDERKSTGCPRSEIAAARLIRDKRVGEIAQRRAGIVTEEQKVTVLTLDEVIVAYLADESRPYDREKGGAQPGTKRSSKADRASTARVRAHLNAWVHRPARLLDREALLDFSKAIERESPTVSRKGAPAAATRRKTTEFLRRVFSWAVENRRKTGVDSSLHVPVQEGPRTPVPAQLEAVLHLLGNRADRALRKASSARTAVREVRRSHRNAAERNHVAPVGSGQLRRPPRHGARPVREERPGA